MNTLTKIVVLLVALIATYSFSQDTLTTQPESLREKRIGYDTMYVYKTVMDALSDEAFKSLQTFYPNSFYWLMGTVLIGFVVLAFLNMRTVTKLNQKIKNLRKDMLSSIKQERIVLEKNIKAFLNDEFQSHIKKETEAAVAAAVTVAFAAQEKKEPLKNQPEKDAEGVEVKRRGVE